MFYLIYFIEWQDECIKEGIHSNNLLLSLPTSGGKTLIAEILLFRQLLLSKKDVIFILPYVALVQEKVCIDYLLAETESTALGVTIVIVVLFLVLLFI